MTDKRKDRRGLTAVKAGDSPPKQDEIQTLADAVANAIEEFKSMLLQVVDSSEQVIVVGVMGGYVTRVVALDPDRHRVMGALKDAYEITAYRDIDEDE